VTFDEIFKRLGSSDASSVGSYLSLTGGYELNLGHFLIDAGLRLSAKRPTRARRGV